MPPPNILPVVAVSEETVNVYELSFTFVILYPEEFWIVALVNPSKGWTFRNLTTSEVLRPWEVSVTVIVEDPWEPDLNGLKLRIDKKFEDDVDF